jgi:hypothetical protein
VYAQEKKEEKKKESNNICTVLQYFFLTLESSMALKILKPASVYYKGVYN